MFLLEIVTPEKMVLKEEVSYLAAPGAEGRFGVFAGHTPFLTRIKPGEASYQKNNKSELLVCGEGFAEVTANRVVMVVRAAEKSGEINLERAEAAKQRAEERLKKSDELDTDFERARAALARALARIGATKVR